MQEIKMKMKKIDKIIKFFFFFLFLIPVVEADAENNTAPMKFPQVSPGSVRRHVVYSSQLSDNYTVDVWLPEGYDAKRSRPYPVIYAQDGQNLYDPKETWNGQSWDIDGVIASLGNEIETPVVVGIRNNPSRFADYMPEAPLASNPGLAERLMRGWGQTEVRGDRYLDFMVNTVKPLMEENYNIRKDADGVIALGSSMGGLISLYAFCEYPDLFGTALCMSTHWLGFDHTTVPEFPTAMLGYLEEKLPSAANHKLYFDHGSKGYDAYYEPWDSRAFELALSKGYEKDRNAMAYYDANGDHNELSWSKRVNIPLKFALGKESEVEPTDPSENPSDPSDDPTEDPEPTEDPSDNPSDDPTEDPSDTPEPSEPVKDVSVYLYYPDLSPSDLFFTFVYNDKGESNMNWPGAPMSFSGDLSVNGLKGNWNVYTVSGHLAGEGKAIVTDNSSRRFPADLQPGIPLEGESLAFIYENGIWSTEKVRRVVSGIEEIFPDLDPDTEATLYTLDGYRVNIQEGMQKCLPKGIYILRQGSAVKKIHI